VKPIKMQELYRSLSRVHRERVMADQQDTDAQKKQVLGKIHVLIAEDGEVNMLLAKTIVRKIAPEAEITCAVNGKLAVEACSKSLPDLILMDIQMPEMNGYEATGHIRKLPGAANIPIIAITAGTVKGEREKCMEAGMSDFIAKPVVEDALVRVFEKWLAVNTNSRGTKKIQGVMETKKHIDFEKLNQYVNNDATAFQGFLMVIQAELEKSLKDIEKFWLKKDLSALKKAGHKLKGTTLSAGLEYLNTFALALDQLLELEEAATATLVENIHTEMSIIQQEIQQQLEKAATGSLS
jgi:CheY-like chemotaxis protein